MKFRTCIFSVLCAGLIPACGRSQSPVILPSLTSSTVSFSGSLSGAGPTDQQVTLLTGSQGYAGGWTATSEQNWLTVTPSSLGSLPPGAQVLLTLHADFTTHAEAWTGATSTVNAVSPREDLGSSWTGSRMILWGGEVNGTLLNTGGLYDPAMDQWTGATSTTGAPSPRTLLSAIFTGSEMIVWGGSTGSQPTSTYYGDGYRYDPNSDSWLGTISTTGAPSARSLHKTVWTGSQMIVWGGYDGTSLLNTGGIYDPASDTWVGATSTVNAPTPRLHHVAAWTGTEMIVWGGQDASGDVATGGRYDPVTDTWTSMSTTGAPTARQAAKAVWTGHEMVVWGGSVVSGGGRNSVNTGARYIPALDSWVAATTTVGAPTARQSHGAVWTGSRMIVSHGASPAAGFFNTGGFYAPPFPETGTYVGTVIITPPSGAPLTIAVTLTVTP